MKKIILVRHGETDWNPLNRIQGHLDIPLNEEGEKQAYQIAHTLENKKIDTFISSPLKRAFKTAQIINKFHTVQIKPEPLIAEIDQGDWNGLLVTEAREKYPDLYKRWQDDPLSVCPPNGESVKQVTKRLATFLERIKQLRERTVLVVSHKVTCAILKILIEKTPATITEIEDELHDLWNRLFENVQIDELEY